MKEVGVGRDLVSRKLPDVLGVVGADDSLDLPYDSFELERFQGSE